MLLRIVLSLSLIGMICSACQPVDSGQPRVFIFTDINIDAGDPDDRQSLIHLLWYADELKIEGIVPDRWDAKGFEACQMVLEAYAKDYEMYLTHKNYPAPDKLSKLIAKDKQTAIQQFVKAAQQDDTPLYVLVWGNMKLFSEALSGTPALAENIRLITIGTGLMLEKNIPHIPESWEVSAPCKQLNWNGAGRAKIYDDFRFDDIWWVEMNWTYEGMFTGEAPAQMFEALSKFGNLGKHMEEVVKNQSWAQYFRVGDTPSVLYLIDEGHNIDDPTQSSWAGQFFQALPKEKPNYYTDFSADLNWDYANPCDTWSVHEQVLEIARGTLEKERPEMYASLLQKLQQIYHE